MIILYYITIDLCIIDLGKMVNVLLFFMWGAYQTSYIY